jgi:SnoaL-like polyketide cyclase
VLSDIDIINSYCEELWNRHDVSAIYRWSSPNGVHHDYPGKTEVLYTDELAKRLKRVFKLLPDHKLLIHEIWSNRQGEVAWRWTVTGTWNGPWKTGAKVNFNGITWYYINNGRICRRYGISDAYRFDYQIGKQSRLINLYMP